MASPAMGGRCLEEAMLKRRRCGWLKGCLVDTSLGEFTQIADRSSLLNMRSAILLV